MLEIDGLIYKAYLLLKPGAMPLAILISPRWGFSPGAMPLAILISPRWGFSLKGIMSKVIVFNDRKYHFKELFDTQSGFYVRSGILQNSTETNQSIDTGVDPFMMNL
ncbi:MAG: hypothetical protein DRR08_07920 [Candidatus Parabeggiatoa sp. nov. 2]|nr:MAG: hypothetical protein B6247_16230 [Beggiatoa sp. 4572_84]RKZ61732.1 MAG: hypothetical protein DRR08_07920 [Gammaproteobacteria bacterium]